MGATQSNGLMTRELKIGSRYRYYFYDKPANKCETLKSKRLVRGRNRNTYILRWKNSKGQVQLGTSTRSYRPCRNVTRKKKN